MPSSSSSPTPPILSQKLRDHYANHGVLGVEEYINQGQGSNNGDFNGNGDHVGGGNKISPTRSSSSLGKYKGQVDKKEVDTNKCISRDDQHPSNSFCGSRFIRLNPRYDKNETLDILTSELPQRLPPIPVPWLSEKLAFYAIPGTFSLVKSKSFQEGRIYGMDVSSGAAVAALLLDDYDYDDKLRPRRTSTQLKSDDSTCCIGTDQQDSSSIHGVKVSTEDKKTSFRVLDLCCAPGLKTCAIADLLSNSDIFHSQRGQLNDIRIVGVDISEQRIQLCKNIVQKYHIDKTTCGGDGDVVHSRCIETLDANHHPYPRIRLYRADGTTFGTSKIDPSSLVFDSHVAIEEEKSRGGRKRMNKSARARQKKKLQKLLASEEEEYNCMEQEEPSPLSSVPPTSSPPDYFATTPHNRKEEVAIQDFFTIPLFDRVLVDAECSTDGAVRHLQQKHKKSNSPYLESDSDHKTNMGSSNHDYTSNYKLTDKNKLAELVDLQKRLIHSGYKLLKPGGILLYSTCSLAVEQNEEVVSWLLKLYSDEASIVPVSFHKDKGSDESNHNVMIYEGSLNGTVRFHPNVTISKEALSTSAHGNTAENNVDKNLYGGGFFLAKIRKKLL